MENEKQKIIHLNTDDEIDFIIDKIKGCKEKEITLIIPENAVILQNLINLKVLRMNAKEFEKNISIVTVDDNKYFKMGNEIKNQASSIKDLIDASDEGLNEKKESEGSALDISSLENLENKKFESKIKMRDIIKKEEVHIDNADSVIKEIRKEKEEKLLQQKEFDQGEIKSAESKGSINIERADDFKKTEKQKRRKIKLPSLSSKFFVGFIIVCFITVLAILGFVLPKSEIDITLKTEALTYDFEFRADELIDKIDSVSNKIPSERIDIISEESGEYPATGKKHVTEKATGKITIYNECSTNMQPLKINTRFLSKDNRIFRIKKSVMIDGFTKPEENKIPGKLVVEVVAEEPGENYNIGKTSFTIPAYQGIWLYECLYARSENSMSGGIDKEVLYFSDSDYLTAKEKLVKIVKEKNENEFSDKMSDEYALLEYLEQNEEIKTKDDVKVGDIVDSFQMTVSVKTTALLVVKNNLSDLIDEKINSELSEEVELVEGSREYKVGEVSKNKNEEILIPVSVSQKSIAKINIDKIKEEIAGKDELELRKYFINIKGIKSTDVGFWPFWVKSIPLSPDKIKITIDINNSM
ncbi:MAG: hypothetical protein KAQ87_00680 [Candidatus Pacebacteria bacterium]|nr:hypothetical protein [Candidatus Paceibacterota bacterium]